MTWGSGSGEAKITEVTEEFRIIRLVHYVWEYITVTFDIGHYINTMSLWHASGRVK